MMMEESMDMLDILLVGDKLVVEMDIFVSWIHKFRLGVVVDMSDKFDMDDILFQLYNVTPQKQGLPLGRVRSES